MLTVGCQVLSCCDSHKRTTVSSVGDSQNARQARYLEATKRPAGASRTVGKMPVYVGSGYMEYIFG